MVTARHPTAQAWRFPPAERTALPGGVRRVNLRELAARPDRLEHHLVVVARVGVAQLELAAASEPLAFAHANVSDEYALPLPSGDPLADAFPMRTFVADRASGEDVVRINQRVNELVLHPHGFLHWPGRLRPPYEPFAFAPGMRRSMASLVFCASRPTPPGERPLFVSAGRADAVKHYRPGVPAMLADLGAEPERLLAVVGDAEMSLLVQPARVAPPRGGYVVVLAGSGAWFATDLVYLPPGAALDGAGLERALLVTRRDGAPEPPPESWERTPAPPFPPFEDAPAGRLPVTVGPLTFDERVPRYWLARLLFRAALHGYRLGYLETYDGWFYDDAGGGDGRLGRRGGSEVTIPRAELPATIEPLYRAIAPPGYTERLT